MLVYVPFFKVIVISVDMFESTIIDERHFSNRPEAESFANEYKCSGGGYWLLYSKCSNRKVGKMTEYDFFLESIPIITNLVIEVQNMTPKDYQKFKFDCIEQTKVLYPSALRFITNVLIVIDYVLFSKVL